MITKEILGEKILRRINGGDPTTAVNVDVRDIYLEIEASRNSLIQELLNSTSNDISSEFETTYENVPVLKDVNRNRFYSTLPSQLISLVIKGNSSNSKGVRQISGMQDEYSVFIPTNSNDTGVFYGLEAGNMGGKVSFWVEGNKVFYENMPYYYENKTVLIKMISSIYSLPEDAFIPIPAGVEKKLEEMVYTSMMAMRGTPVSKNADNTASQK